MFLPYYRDKTVIVIGSGLGCIAAVAIDAGARAVLGLDRQEDIPLTPHRYVDYVPYYVNLSNEPGKYIQLMESYTTTGDWFNESISDHVMRNDPGEGVICIDVEGSDNGDVESMLAPLWRDRTTSLTLWRTTLNRFQLDCTISRLQNRCTKVEAIVQSDVGGWVTCVLVIHGLYARPSKTRLTHCLHPTLMAPHCSLTSPGVDKLPENLALASYHLIGTCVGYTREHVRDLMFMNYLQGKLYRDTRESYREWTKVILAVITLELACRGDVAISAALEEIAEKEVYSLSIASEEVMTEQGTRLAAHLRSFGARIARCTCQDGT